MKKLFSFCAALLMAGTMMATNLFDKSTATFESWFGDAGWATITTSTASYDATTGSITCNINQAPYGQWHAQLKLHTTGITLDASKNYEFSCKFHSTIAFGGVTVKVFDDAQLAYTGDFAVVDGDTTYTSAAFAGASVGNGIIVFDLGNATNGAVVTISDITLQETAAPVVEDPKPTTAPAAPTADAASVASVYSNTYPAAAAFGYCESWGQTTSMEELNFDGNTVLYYKNFNYLGWATSNPIDASEDTGLHMDIWAPAAGSVKVTPIYGGTGLSSDDTKGKVVTLAEGWNSFDWTLATDFAGLNLNSIFQFKFSDGNISQLAVDNAYFYGRTSTVTYTNLSDVYSLAKNDTITLKNFEVVYVNADYCYIKDATASGLIFKKNYGLVAGDKVAKGLVAKISIYNNLYELVPITAKDDLTIEAGTPAEPELATAAPTAADNKYLVYKNVTFLADSIGTSSTAARTAKGIFGNDTITFYNTFKIAAVAFEAGKKYDVVGFNTCHNTDIQVTVASITEHAQAVDECAGEHGLYDPAKATINNTYFASNNWGANAGCTADISNGVITIHVDQPFVDMWQGQVFVDPGFTFEAGKMYHYEFDVKSAGKVCMQIKVNNDDNNYFFWDQSNYYDKNIGGGTFHFSTDSVIANANLNTEKGPLVFGFGWTDGNQDITISCIKISEIGVAPEKHMYIKHAWAAGAEATWAEMKDTTYMTNPAWEYTGMWNGNGFSVNEVAEDTNAKLFAQDAIQFLTTDGLLWTPENGTDNCQFYYIPTLDNGKSQCVYVIAPAKTALETVAGQTDVQKIIRNGQVIIIRNGVEYNALGQQL